MTQSHHHHFAKTVSLRGLRSEIAKVEGFNAKVAVAITKGVGTMASAYVFCLLALVSLPAVLTEVVSSLRTAFPHWLIGVSLIALVAWIAQTFLQLVLLPIIMVGQNVQAAASDDRAVKTFKDTEEILDRLDTRTEGGIKEIIDRLDAMEAKPPGRKK